MTLAVITIALSAGTVITGLVGLAVPALIALVTRASLPAKGKVLLTLLLTTISGAVTSIVTWPTTSSGWWLLVWNILLTFLAAAAADVAAWIPSGASKLLHAKTDKRFGIGKYDPTLQL